MLKLLGTDLKRIIKDKLFIVICIIGGLFALLNPLINLVLVAIVKIPDPSYFELLGLAMSGKVAFFTFFNPSNNFGLILPIFISIIIFKDFSNGTIRNKIICGHSRTNIFVSIFLSTFISLFSILLVNALISFGLTMLFSPYQIGEYTGYEFLYFIESLVYITIAYIFIASIIAFISVFVKNVGLSIIFYLAIAMGAIFMGSIFTTAEIFIDSYDFIGKEIVSPIVKFLNSINVFMYVQGSPLTDSIGSGTRYELATRLYYIFTPLVGTGLLGLLGILVINKRDI